MTDNEIINALECCTRPIRCRDCDYIYRDACRNDLMRDANELVKRQLDQINDLKIELSAMRGAANSLKAEIERLSGILETRCEKCPRDYNNNPLSKEGTPTK